MLLIHQNGTVIQYTDTIYVQLVTINNEEERNQLKIRRQMVDFDLKFTVFILMNGPSI